MKTIQTSARGRSGALLLLASVLALIANHQARAQDILRRTSNNNNNQAANQQQLNALANIQLPPQFASLTPQQLHQLARLRELQLQQNAPAPIGLEIAAAVAPTTQPAANPASGQIPQPGGAAGEPTHTNNERHDDSSHNEAGSEEEGVAMSPNSSSPGAVPMRGTGSGGADSVSSSAPTFEVNWNKCPQLEPSESEKSKKTQVITRCLHAAPIPSNLTRENVEAHREQIATCALKVEGWFDEQGRYKYDKAESELRAKRLDKAIESQVLKFHVACTDEASKKFPHDQNKLIDQVQFYQACMDYYISIVCEIEVSVDQ